ncbi:MAG: hypothetical protein GY787_20785, partial [Alteromonadales bacterium]|nr:hypothetical protein [Alteromonadales bacterium]
AVKCLSRFGAIEKDTNNIGYSHRFLLGSISAIYIEEIPFDVSAILGVVFTGVAALAAALAAAYAALSASRSARVAEQSASIWKKQMRLDVELSEAKKLKIALNSWHRHFANLVDSHRISWTYMVTPC